MNKVRIYGKLINKWKSYDEKKKREIVTQVEHTYKEFDENGNLINTGSEDFSIERFNSQTERRHIYVWDGKRYNKGGYRWFDYEDSLLIRKGDLKGLKAYLKAKYPNAQLIEARLK